MLFVINVDETPEPWEDYSMPYCVFEGTREQAEAHCDKIEKKHPKWLVMPVQVENPDIVRGPYRLHNGETHTSRIQGTIRYKGDIYTYHATAWIRSGMS